MGQLAAGTDRTHMTLNMTLKMMDTDRDDGSSSSLSSSPDCRGSMVQEVKRRRKKKKQRSMVPTFSDLYKLTGDTLGEGSYGKVQTCVNISTGMEYAVKTIEKKPGLHSRSKVMKEIEIYYICQGQNNIIQLMTESTLNYFGGFLSLCLKYGFNFGNEWFWNSPISIFYWGSFQNAHIWTCLGTRTKKRRNMQNKI